MNEEERWKLAIMNADVGGLEKHIRGAITSMQTKIVKIEKDQLQLDADVEYLEIAYEKRKEELRRGEQRLAAILNVRPAYMDEYENLQKELQQLFLVYLEKSRNLQWLESQVEGLLPVDLQETEGEQGYKGSFFSQNEASDFASISPVNGDSGGDFGKYLMAEEMGIIQDSAHYEERQRGKKFYIENHGELKKDLFEDESSDAPSIEQYIDDNGSDNMF